MKRRGGAAKQFVVLMVVVVGAAWLVRWRCRAKDDAPPPAVTDAAAHADAPVIDAPPADVPPDAAIVVVGDAVAHYDGPFSVGAISADGERALLVASATRYQGLQFRVVAIDRNAIETDVEVFHDPEHQTPDALAADVATVLPVLRRFPLGAARFGDITASPDGTTGAYNLYDDTFMFAAGKTGVKATLPAAYEPTALPDGKTVLVSGYDGRDKTEDGKYSLFAVALATGKPTRVAGTEGYDGVWAVKGNLLRAEVGQAEFPVCIVEIPLDVRPLRVTNRVCPEHADRLDVRLSPSGDWIVWTARDGEHARMRSMELATKRVDLDVDEPGDALVSDDGHVVITRLDEVTVWDPSTHQIAPGPAGVDGHCAFRTTIQLVCPAETGVRVVSLR